MNILGTGMSGLVGSRIVELLGPEFTFADLSHETGVDITDYTRVNSRIAAANASWVFHLAAFTDVDGAQKQRAEGEKSLAWQVNVAATENIATACKRSGKRLLYISTDYVFKGDKPIYSESDLPDPQGWYALTKYEGEKRVASLGRQALIIRIANPYRAATSGKLDFVHKIISRLQAGQSVMSPIDQLFMPTFIDDIAMAIGLLVKKDVSGLYHVVGGGALSPFAAAIEIATVFGFDKSLVKETTFAQFFGGRAPRPFHAVLKHDKIDKLGIKMRTFAQGLAEVRRQLSV